MSASVKQTDFLKRMIGRQPSHMLALERRIMLDAAAATTATDGVDAQSGDESQTPQADDSQFVEAQPQSQTPNARPIDPAGGKYHSNVTVDNNKREVVFVDSAVVDYQNLLSDANANAEIYLLDANQDGVQQMSAILKALQGQMDYQAVDVLHLISHGDQGKLRLGNTYLTAESMQDAHAQSLSIIGNALSEQADILIYGCNFAEGDAGFDAVSQLSALTEADVAASTDETGHADDGGDWVLELKLGEINSDIIIGESGQANWQGLLDNVIANDDAYSVDTGDVLNVDIPGVMLNDQDPNVSAFSRINQAYHFDGTGGAFGASFSQLPGDPSNADASFELWFKAANFTRQVVLLESGGTVDGMSIFLRDADADLVYDDLTYLIKDGGVNASITIDLTTHFSKTPAQLSEEFIQVVATYDTAPTDEMNLYLNGAIAGNAMQAGLNDWSGSNAAGLGQVGGNAINATAVAGFDPALASYMPFEGDIAIQRFYESVLSAGEALQNFNAASGVGSIVSSDLTLNYEAELDPNITDNTWPNAAAVNRDWTLSGGASHVGIRVFAVNGNSADINTQINLPSGALLTLNDDGSFDYFNNTFFGPSDSFEYTIKDKDNNEDTATVTITINQVIDLSVLKTVDNMTPNVGDNVTFTVVVNNSLGSADATGIELEDILPSGLSFVSAVVSEGTYSAGTGVWTLGELSGGESATLTLTATVEVMGDYTNLAQITKVDQPNPNPGADHDYASVMPNPNAVDDNYNVNFGDTLQVLMPGILTNDTDPAFTNYTNLTAAYAFNSVNNVNPHNGGVGATFQNLPGNPTNNSASFEIWFKPFNLGTSLNPGDSFVLFESGAAGDGVSLIMRDSDSDGEFDDVVFLIKDSSANASVEVDLTQALFENGFVADPTGEFIQIVGVYERNSPGATDTIRIYLNGVLIDASAPQANLNDWSGGNPAGIGQQNSGINATGVAGFNPAIASYKPFEGDIAIFRFYEQALTAAQVSQNYDFNSANTQPLFTTNLTLNHDASLDPDLTNSLWENAAAPPVYNWTLSTGVTPAGLEFIKVNGNTFIDGEVINLTSGGVLTIFKNGGFDYDSSGYMGLTGFDSFTYTLLNEKGQEGSAIVTIYLSFSPEVDVAKFGPDEATVGDVISYQYELSNNDISGDGSPVKNVQVNDDVTGMPIYVSGDVNHNGLLEVGETWLYNVTYQVKSTDSNPLVNIVTVTGEGLDSVAIAPAKDSHSLTVTFIPVPPAPSAVGSSVDDSANFPYYLPKETQLVAHPYVDPILMMFEYQILRPDYFYPIDFYGWRHAMSLISVGEVQSMPQMITLVTSADDNDSVFYGVEDSLFDAHDMSDGIPVNILEVDHLQPASKVASIESLFDVEVVVDEFVGAVKATSEIQLDVLLEPLTEFYGLSAGLNMAFHDQLVRAKASL